MNKAYKFRIYPTDEQKIVFAKTFGCVRFIYNKMLEDRIAYYEATKESLKNTPAQYKKDFPWLKEVDSLALANAQVNLNTAYNNFFRDPKIGFPKFKSKHRGKMSYTTNCVKNNIRIENGKLKLPKVGFLKIKLHRQVPDNYILKSVTVSQTPTGKYYASILFEYEEDIPEVTEFSVDKTIGLDFSMSGLFVSSEPEIKAEADFLHHYRKAQQKLAREQRKLSHCAKGSNRYYKQKHRVALIHEKVANQRKDFLHKKSRQIANAYDLVCIEDLNMKAMAQCLKFGKSIADNGWGMFTTFLSYKLAEQDKRLVKVDKWYPSSKTCHVCGYKLTELMLKDRVWICPECGEVLDRDKNASINIKNEGLRMTLA